MIKRIKRNLTDEEVLEAAAAENQDKKHHIKSKSGIVVGAFMTLQYVSPNAVIRFPVMKLLDMLQEAVALPFIELTV